jgi:predicted RNA polymerase sigma factor
MAPCPPYGPAAALAALDALGATLTGYHLLPSVRGDLLVKLGRFAEAREEIQRAIAMTENRREQDLLSEKLKHIPNDKQDV